MGIERLKKQLANLEAKQKSRGQLNSEESRIVSDVGTHGVSNPAEKRGDSAEGRSLGTFNGRTDLDTFLVRVETCSRHFGWTGPEKVFHLMNALTDAVEPIVKEVGPAGTLEHILELLQTRFGNKLQIDKFHADLRRRKRGPDETLQELYLDLCRLRVLASGENSDEKYPEIYFRNIFVDSLGDRELKRAVLIQNPGTMEAAYNVATRLEMIFACERPVRDRSENKSRVRQLDLDNGNQESSQQSAELIEDVARRIEELEGALQSMQMMTDTERHDQYFPFESSFDESFQEPVQYLTSEVTGGPSHGYGHHRKNHEIYDPLGRGERSDRPIQRTCFACGENGHIRRDCKKPHNQWKRSECQDTQTNPQNYQTRSGDRVLGTRVESSSPTKVRREAYLEVCMGSRKVLALLDSGCEQSVMGRNLMRKVPLEPTSKTLSTADGTEIPLLGETTIELSVSGYETSVRVVVTEAITELILGIEWLQQNECEWDFGRNSFLINGHRGRLRYKGASRTMRRILLQDDVEVPGMHTVEVSVLVTRSSLSHEGRNWGMTTKMKSPELVVANAIYGSNNVHSVCQIINISDLPKGLKKGSELGKAEPIEILEKGTARSSTKTNETRRPAFDEMPLDLRQISTDEQEPQYEDVEKFDQTTSSGSTEPGPTDFIQEMMNKVEVDLTDDQRDAVERLLQENRGVFSTSEFDLGRTNLVSHTIDTGTNRPFKQQL